MAKVKIATVQFPVDKNIKKNLIHIKEYLMQAAKKKVRLIHFSETALSGYGGVEWNDFTKVDWAYLKEATKEIMALCQKYKIWCVLGSSHFLDLKTKPHNCLYVINDKGKIVNRYDKRFCTGGDLKHYSPGDHFSTFFVDGVKFGLLICYDLRFPELYREYLKLNIHCMLHSFYNANRKTASIHDMIITTSLQCRAATNYFYVIANNSSKKHQCWSALLINPDGSIQSQLKKHQKGILIETIDTKKKFYDAGAQNKYKASQGVLNSGKLPKHPKSKILKGLS